MIQSMMACAGLGAHGTISFESCIRRNKGGRAPDDSRQSFFVLTVLLVLKAKGICAGYLYPHKALPKVTLNSVE